MTWHVEQAQEPPHAPDWEVLAIHEIDNELWL